MASGARGIGVGLTGLFLITCNGFHTLRSLPWHWYSLWVSSTLESLEIWTCILQNIFSAAGHPWAGGFAHSLVYLIAAIHIYRLLPRIWTCHPHCLDDDQAPFDTGALNCNDQTVLRSSCRMPSQTTSQTSACPRNLQDITSTALLATLSTPQRDGSPVHHKGIVLPITTFPFMDVAKRTRTLPLHKESFQQWHCPLQAQLLATTLNLYSVNIYTTLTSAPSISNSPCP